MDIFYSRVLTW